MESHESACKNSSRNPKLKTIEEQRCPLRNPKLKTIEEQPAKRKNETKNLLESTERQRDKKRWESGKCLERLSLCGICMDKKTKIEMFRSKNCSHSYCLVCIGKYVAAKISENAIKVKCPDLACNRLLEPQDCRSVVPQQLLDRWEVALCESVLGSKKIYCPFKDCSAPLVVDDGRQAVTSAECPHCHRLFCAQCKVPWHAGSECKGMSDIMDQKFIDLARMEKWQKCPNCKFYVQKIHGCESISCRCGYKFCYVCGKGWAFGHFCQRGETTVHLCPSLVVLSLSCCLCCLFFVWLSGFDSKQ